MQIGTKVITNLLMTMVLNNKTPKKTQIQNDLIMIPTHQGLILSWNTMA
jgi:hypothetical protein